MLILAYFLVASVIMDKLYVIFHYLKADLSIFSNFEQFHVFSLARAISLPLEYFLLTFFSKPLLFLKAMSKSVFSLCYWIS